MISNARIDPITTSVIQGGLENIAVEMGHKLMRMSYSSIIRESEDFGAAVVDATGLGLAESAQSTPLQSGPIPGYVRGVLAELARRADEIRPGDVVMHNDAYGGASHGPDVAFIVPVFHRERLVAFTATTAHHLDIGALSPGSCGIVDAMDAYAEGLQFKAIKVYDRGVRNGAVWQILRDNIRASDLVVGDMEAQIAAARIGAERLAELVERYGIEVFQSACAALLDHAERLMRQAIARMPDGVYRAETAIDGYLDSSDPTRRELPIVVTITKQGEEMTVDLTGTAPQVPDRPINMPLEGTVDIAVWLTVRSVLLDTAVHGHIPVNAGLVRPIKLVVPKGCLANPIFPAPTIARFCPGNQLADTVMKALAQAVPRQVSAGIGNLKVIAFSGLEGERHWVHMEIFEGSYGGRFGRDGMDAVDTLYANTRNNPIEDVETHLPLRVLRYELRDDAIGAGAARGGLGSIREFQMLAPGGASVEGEGHRYRPWGFEGGEAGVTAKLDLVMPSGEIEALPSKVPHRAVPAGARFVCYGPAGGGYGAPLVRDPKDVLDDVLDGLISTETAAARFGVVIADDGQRVDETATAALRTALPPSQPSPARGDGVCWRPGAMATSSALGPFPPCGGRLGWGTAHAIRGDENHDRIGRRDRRDGRVGRGRRLESGLRGRGMLSRS